MIKYIVGTLLILWSRLVNLTLIKRNKVLRTEPKVPWYRQLVWFYSEPTNILPNLYLGSAFNAYDIDKLSELNIRVVINVTKEIENFHEENLILTYYKYPIADDNKEDITDILSQSYEQIDMHLSSGDNVLVHCYM